MGITKLTTNGVNGTKYDIASADNYYMEPIATQLLGSSQATITFSNIPQTYKHLQLRMLTRDSAAQSGSQSQMQINGDTGSNYNWHAMEGNGASASAAGGTGSTTYIYGFDRTSAGSNGASIFGADVVDILDYANVYKFKTIRALGGYDANGSGVLKFASGLWMNTAAITSFSISLQSGGSYVQHSRFSLYGIRG